MTPSTTRVSRSETFKKVCLPMWEKHVDKSQGQACIHLLIKLIISMTYLQHRTIRTNVRNIYFLQNYHFWKIKCINQVCKNKHWVLRSAALHWTYTESEEQQIYSFSFKVYRLINYIIASLYQHFTSFIITFMIFFSR